MGLWWRRGENLPRSLARAGISRRLYTADCMAICTAFALSRNPVISAKPDAAPLLCSCGRTIGHQLPGGSHRCLHWRRSMTAQKSDKYAAGIRSRGGKRIRQMQAASDGRGRRASRLPERVHPSMMSPVIVDITPCCGSRGWKPGMDWGIWEDGKAWGKPIGEEEGKEGWSVETLKACRRRHVVGVSCDGGVFL